MISLDRKTAELVGIILGDGNIWSDGKRFEITITGNPKTDNDYFRYINGILKTKTGKKPYCRIRGLGLRTTVKSKELFLFLTNTLGIRSGLAKSKSPIPIQIRRNPNLTCKLIRGLFDTDGSVFTSNKKGALDYPTIEITNGNRRLVTDTVNTLKKLGFRIRVRRNGSVFKIAINGYEMIAKWNEVIGSSNWTKKQKINQILLRNISSKPQ